MGLEEVKMIAQSFLFFLLSVLVLSCAPAISPKLMAKVDSSLTFGKVLQDPDACKGKTVLWGGKVIQVLPQDETTFIEILQMPLGWRGKPEEAYASEGKFLISITESLDFSQFDRGKKITVAGEIQGTAQQEKIESLSEGDYRYPVISTEEIHLWKDYLYPYSDPQPYPGRYWYDPTQRGLRF
ncbi:MAG: Slp family lipoprotein [Thermodesulfobacteriota bacterium]|jgi:outer membrane lipoprotein